MNLTPLFSLGKVVATPAALAVLDRHNTSPSQLLSRHVAGDWGDTCHEDKNANETALTEGERLLSVYRLTKGESTPSEDATIWVITEADRSSTCLLLPEDY